MLQPQGEDRALNKRSATKNLGMTPPPRGILRLRIESMNRRRGTEYGSVGSYPGEHQCGRWLHKGGSQTGGFGSLSGGHPEDGILGRAKGLLKKIQNHKKTI